MHSNNKIPHITHSAANQRCGFIAAIIVLYPIPDERFHEDDVGCFRSLRLSVRRLRSILKAGFHAIESLTGRQVLTRQERIPDAKTVTATPARGAGGTG